MRGTDERSGRLFSYVAIRCARSARSANDALSKLTAIFEAMYAPLGRQSIAPEKLLRASLLQAF